MVLVMMHRRRTHGYFDSEADAASPSKQQPVEQMMQQPMPRTTTCIRRMTSMSVQGSTLDWGALTVAVIMMMMMMMMMVMMMVTMMMTMMMMFMMALKSLIAASLFGAG